MVIFEGFGCVNVGSNAERGYMCSLHFTLVNFFGVLCMHVCVCAVIASIVYVYKHS